MLEFLRESLLCNTEEPPQKGGRRAVCCTGTPSQRRPAEVISSQGAPVMAKNEIPAALPWDQPRPKRDTTPLRNRSPMQSFRSTASLSQSPLGTAIACSTAALGDEGPGRGLYVAMQRGLGPREPARDRRNDGSPTRPRPSTPLRRNRPRVAACPAVSYEALSEDTLDVYMQRLARCLPQNGARSLYIRRLSRGEYEVDGCRVSITMRGGEAYAYSTNSNDELGRGETLQSYLLRAADRSLVRSMSGPSGASFNHHEVMSRVPLAPRGTASMPVHNSSPYAGVLVRAPDGGSFLLGSSFYSVPDPSAQNAEAMHLMQTQKHQLQHSSSRQASQGSFYLEAPNWRNYVPAVAPGAYPVPMQALYGHGHPSFVAVSG
ncbi:unnamed protein product [Effrenium voratum]|nr:unnamed protein product [Effrenium voratum]